MGQVILYKSAQEALGIRRVSAAQEDDVQDAALLSCFMALAPFTFHPFPFPEIRLLFPSEEDPGRRER